MSRPAITRESSAIADGRFHLLRAADDTKDQSYFLFTLGQDELRERFFRSAR